jgi:hypothetical protein
MRNIGVKLNYGKDVFDFEDVEKITCIYTNPPYKADIPQKSGIKKYKNASFFF